MNTFEEEENHRAIEVLLAFIGTPDGLLFVFDEVEI